MGDGTGLGVRLEPRGPAPFGGVTMLTQVDTAPGRSPRAPARLGGVWSRRGGHICQALVAWFG